MATEKGQIDIIDTAAISDEENGNFDRSWRDEKWGDRKLSAAAQEVAQSDENMSIREAIRCYPNAILWCLTISTCVIMEGSVHLLPYIKGIPNTS